MHSKLAAPLYKSVRFPLPGFAHVQLGSGTVQLAVA